MSPLLVVLAYVAAVNPARVRSAVPESAGRGAPMPLAVGANVTLVLTLLLVGSAESILGAFDITDETWRIGAGIVVGLMAITALVLPAAPAEPSLAGWAAGLVPVAFPVLVTPQLVALAVAFGATESFALAAGGAVVGLAVAVAVARMRRTHPSRWLAASRFLAAFLVIAAIALVVEGIRDV